MLTDYDEVCLLPAAPYTLPHPDDIRASLDAARVPQERISSLDPRGLHRGAWWPSSWAWPDALRAGLLEPVRGYRYKPENLALGRVLHPLRNRWTNARVADLGAGSGSLLLLARVFLRTVRCVGVERQERMASFLQRNASAYGVPNAAMVADLRLGETHERILDRLQGRADVIVSNPPFFPEGWGRESKNETTHASTHALHGGVGEFLDAARALLHPEGVVIVVYDANRLGELVAALGRRGFSVRSILWTAHSHPPELPDQPLRVLVTCDLSTQGCRVEALLELA